MSHITIIRHGQANTGAKDEHSYDKLSELGHQQARWLGDHFEQTGESFQHVYCGTMRRHIETTEGIGGMRYAEVVQDARLNEFPYYGLELAMFEQYGLALPTTREEFALHLPKTLETWASGKLDAVPETFESFSQRVNSVIHELAQNEGKTLVITSAGVISTLLRNMLTLTPKNWSHMCLAIRNSSVHKCETLFDDPMITQFNAVPHLDTADRAHALTYL